MNTKTNLLRAYAGECQARMRYEMAACIAKKQKLPVIEKMFTFTAAQEKEHAEIFYKHLQTMCKDETISTEVKYVIDTQEELEDILEKAAAYGYEEATATYPKFAAEAKEEGYLDVASSFLMLADIEKSHYERFLKYKQWIETKSLFTGEATQSWMCLNCGFIYEGSKAPEACPSCKHEQGFFIRQEEAPFG
jgi:Rubrerythrin